MRGSTVCGGYKDSLVVPLSISTSACILVDIESMDVYVDGKKVETVVSNAYTSIRGGECTFIEGWPYLRVHLQWFTSHEVCNVCCCCSYEL